MSVSTAEPSSNATLHIIKLKDDDNVNIKTHIEDLRKKYNGNGENAYRVTHEWDSGFVKAYVGEFSPHVLKALESHPDVEYISEDSETGEFDIVEQEDAGWGLSRINQTGPLSGKDSDVDFKYKYDGTSEAGAGVDIYILDTGIYIDHVDFGGRAIRGTTIAGSDEDTSGHGTHVAGIAGGTRWGVAKAARLIAVKKGSGVANTVKGIEWILTRVQQTKVPSVVNMSHGVPKRNRFWNEQVTKLVQCGIHVVVAAGNRNWDARNTSPASAPLVNTVGSIDFEDKKAESSNYGPCVDFFAPGRHIRSCWITDKTATKVLSGTSMAAPVVTGIIATFISLHGDLPPLMMTNILRTLSLKGKLLEIPSGTANALVRGALHIGAMFSMESQWASMRLLDGTPSFDIIALKRILIQNDTNIHNIRVPVDDDSDAAAKLETVTIFSRAILSKVSSGASVYNSNVTEFNQVLLVCKGDDGLQQSTISVPLMIVSNYPAIDIALDRDSAGRVSVSFAGNDYVNHRFDPESGGDFNQVVFKACPLE